MKSYRDRPDSDLPLKKRKISEANHDQLVILPIAIIPTGHTALFAVPAPIQPARIKNPLRIALEQHFNLMNEKGLQPFHYTEILREIACFHRKDGKPEEKDIFAAALFMYEKALIIEPLNNYAAKELAQYKAQYKAPLSLSILAKHHMEDERLTRYHNECKQFGRINFFWISIEKHLERLKTIYPDNFNEKVAEVCNHLNLSLTVQSMRVKHIPMKEMSDSHDAFNHAIEQLVTQAPSNQARHF